MYHIYTYIYVSVCIISSCLYLYSCHFHKCSWTWHFSRPVVSLLQRCFSLFGRAMGSLLRQRNAAAGTVGAQLASSTMGERWHDDSCASDIIRNQYHNYLSASILWLLSSLWYIMISSTVRVVIANQPATGTWAMNDNECGHFNFTNRIRDIN